MPCGHALGRLFGATSIDPMLPSLLAREVLAGLKQFLMTGFEPSDPLFWAML